MASSHYSISSVINDCYRTIVYHLYILASCHPIVYYYACLLLSLFHVSIVPAL